MKTKSLITVVGLLLLASCSHDADLVDSREAYQENKANENAEKVLGFKINPNQDWRTTTAGKVTVSVNPAEVDKVQVLACIDEVNPDGTTGIAMMALNECEVGNQTSINLYYDAPIVNRGLYVAYLSNTNFILEPIGSVSAGTRATTVSTATHPNFDDVPDSKLAGVTLSEPFESYVAHDLNGTKVKDMLYEYTKQQVTTFNPFDEVLTNDFTNAVFSYFPNKGMQNLDKLKRSGFYNENGYPTTTGDRPIVVSPVYKHDGGNKYGNEILNSDLYYYYYDEADYQKATNKLEFLIGLPKYKAFDFLKSNVKETTVKKANSYALVYWKENGQPTFKFPAGLKLGFMLRSHGTKTYEYGKHTGELFGDGRLNNDVNLIPNFDSSGFKTDDPRMAWFTLNGRYFLCCESGTDADFNDVMLEVEGGIKDIPPFIPFDPFNYTFCFEDTEEGDYDLNDVVILASRIEKTKVLYSVIACGAYDELYIKGLGVGSEFENTEVHAMLGKDQNMFINTTGKKNADAYTVTKTVSESFSFDELVGTLRIKNATKGNEVPMSKTGQAPHGVMITGKFNYPTERTLITDAYPNFGKWAEFTTEEDWYKTYNSGLVFVW